MNNEPGAVSYEKIWRVTPWFSRLAMLPLAFLFARIGKEFIFNPVQATSPMNMALNSPVAMTDMRVFGALLWIIPITLGYCILSDRRLREGHAIAILLAGLTLAARLYGFHMDGTTAAMGLEGRKLHGEKVLLALNLIGLAVESARRRRAGAARLNA